MNSPAPRSTLPVPRRYDTIYLSPHLDDAALSCGGQIHQQTAAGRPILIVTITAGDPPAVPPSSFAQLLHDRWQLAGEVVAGRRAEDIAASQRLGADYLHWDVLDCIYRVDPDSGAALYPSVEAIFGPVHPAEIPLVTALAQRLAALPPCRQIIAPLAVGRHVDHQLVRAAAEQWQGNALTYYEDYPYVQQPGALAEAAAFTPAEWRAITIPLSPADLQAKYDAVTCFRSQLSTFFADPADLERQIGAYATAIGGERLWQRGRIA
jgi:LmbE family N-acetylglucosaminyl deacetylase